jgi:hypothetical protein
MREYSTQYGLMSIFFGILGVADSFSLVRATLPNEKRIALSVYPLPPLPLPGRQTRSPCPRFQRARGGTHPSAGERSRLVWRGEGDAG